MRPPLASRDQTVGLTRRGDDAGTAQPSGAPAVSFDPVGSKHAEFLEPNGNRVTLCDRAHPDALVN